MVEQAIDLIMEAHFADAERAGTADAITTVVDLLVVLVHRTEAAITGEEVRVTLRFRAPADVLLASELPGRLVGEVVADDTRRKPSEVDLLQRAHEAAALMRLLASVQRSESSPRRTRWVHYAPTPRRRRGR